ncbi:MAG: HNH endonuclease [Candidatus Nanopelagicales bacterium]
MAISKALRFQILRRDGYKCHYCGADAEQSKLRVDHVIPQALGGPTEPANLVTACHDCNAGKAAMPPDAAAVEQLDERNVAWAEAIQKARREFEESAEQRRKIVRQFLSIWDEFLSSDALPDTFDSAVLTWLDRGLTMDDFQELTLVTATKSGLYRSDQFRYFAGCCWRRLTRMEERAAEILADQEDA